MHALTTEIYNSSNPARDKESSIVLCSVINMKQVFLKTKILNTLNGKDILSNVYLARNYGYYTEYKVCTFTRLKEHQKAVSTLQKNIFTLMANDVTS